MNRFRHPLARFFTALACALPLAACANKDFPYSSPAVEGKVIDKETQKPVPNALVAVLWKGHLGWTGTVCYHVETTTTDATGTYRIPAWKKTLPFGEITSRYRAPTAYIPGYEYVEANKDIVYVKPFAGTRGERFQSLWRVVSSTGCNSAGRTRRNLYPLYKVVYEEAKPLATTDEERQRLQMIREIAASEWVARDARMTTEESRKLVEGHLRDHLQ